VEIAFRLVDVFAERPYEGNRLCVVPEPPEDLSAETMQTIANEINFSETVFVTATRPDGYDVRIFTPDSELPFAGHPTLGAAFVLASEGRIGSEAVQVSLAGEVPVEVQLGGRATMRQLPPTFRTAVEDRAAVAAAAGLEPSDLIDDLPIVPVTTGLQHIMVPVRDEVTLRRAVREDGITAVCDNAEGSESLYLFAVRGDGDVMARMFDRLTSIGEDPATGSAAGPLGAYLSEHELAGMPGVVVIAQGEMVKRPSFLGVRTERRDGTWSIAVSGGVRWVGEGRFVVPDG
jgi:trans-2,3-dihydro-3-hydroxyanthranilate isomerase